ncbi:MAG: RNA polymerase sporulation sigma factor SigK [Clostridia bacterium]|nr:RNA polymerase sporulation sigma factor SigK [Clostridia bacterium]
MLTELLNAVLSHLLYFTLHLQNAGSFPKPLSAKEERACFEKMKAGDKAAQKKLVEHNLRLVAHIIKKYYAQSGEEEDLISIGTIGLIKAVNSFDYGKGTRLATYASRCIENEILMYFRAQRKTAQDISMNEPIDADSEGNPLTLSDVIYEEDDIAEKIDDSIRTKMLYTLIEQLEDEREKRIVIMRYGLYNRKPLTQQQVAQRLGISRSYVSRIEKRVLERLRSQLE